MIRSKWVYLSAAAVLFTLLCDQTAWASCAKAAVLSGTACENLKVNFDLSECEEESATTAPELKCNYTHARAILTTPQNTYRATIKKNGDTDRWMVVGSVTQEKLHTDRESNAVPAIALEKSAENLVPSEEASVESAHLENQGEKKPDSNGAEEAKILGLNFNGSFDSYYSFNFNKPPLVTAPTAKGPSGPRDPNNGNRFYDMYHNQMTINLVELEIKRNEKEVSFVADLDFGQMADQNAADPITPTATDEVTKHIGQAVISYEPSRVKGLSIDIGKMPTHLGLETPKAKENWQYSRSSIFWYGIPLWHTGIHIGYAFIPKKLTIGAYVYNGWNTMQDYNTRKTLGGQMKWTPNKKWTLIYNVIGGPENAANNSDMKIVHEANALWNLNSKWSFAAEMVSGSAAQFASSAGTLDHASWRGVSLHSKTQISPTYYLSPRFEVFQDRTGALLGSASGTVQAQTLRSFTLTNGIQLSSGFETRLEGRLDRSSDKDHFFKSGNETRADQMTVLASFLYNF